MDPIERKLFAKRIWDAGVNRGIEEGMRRALIVIEAQQKLRTFSADAESPRRSFMQAFTGDQFNEAYSTYFTSEHYPEGLPRYANKFFGMSDDEFGRRSGRELFEVEHPDGKIVYRWLNPSEVEGLEDAPKEFAAANRGHLRRVQITNKNGVKTWVWRNPNKGKPKEDQSKGVEEPPQEYHPTRESEETVAKALADPSKLTPDQFATLADHLDVLQKDKLKKIARDLSEKAGGRKQELVNRLLEKLKSKEEKAVKPTPTDDVPEEKEAKEEKEPLEEKEPKATDDVPEEKEPLEGKEPKATDEPTPPAPAPTPPSQPAPDLNKPQSGEQAVPESTQQEPINEPQSQPRPADDRGGGAEDAGVSPAASGPVAGQTGSPSAEGNDRSGEGKGQPTGEATHGRVPAEIGKVNRQLDRFTNFFRAKGQHEVATWMDQLKNHVNTVGTDAALAELGTEQVGDEGAAFPGWPSMSDFTRSYLDRHGIEVSFDSTEENPTDVAKLAPLKKFISNVASGYTVLARPDASDFYPSLPVLKDKLAEAQHLPGLEKSEDIGKLMGGNTGDVVTHFSPDVIAKLDETYGKGTWIVKSYGDEAYAGYGIFFPQRVQQVQTDARNAIWASGEKLARYGFTHSRDEKGRITGIKHTGGKDYKFGTEEFDKTIQGDVREACDAISQGKVTKTSAGTDVYTGPAIESETHTAFPTGSFMGQPAFPVVGISEEERAQGVTFKKGQEGRTHVITRNGKAELVPHSTWLKMEHLPVVFEDDNTRAMAKAALDAINALPESERQGQIYAPDILPTADGYKVVEANPSNMAGSSGYLENNPMVIDAYVSHLTGREPAHVSFIRKLLTQKKRESSGGERTFSTSHHDGEEWQSGGRWYRRTYGKTIRIARPGTKVVADERHVKDVVAPSTHHAKNAADKLKPIHEESKKLNNQYEDHANMVAQLTTEHQSLKGTAKSQFMRERLTPALTKLDSLAKAKLEVAHKKRAALMEALKPPTPQKIAGNFRSGIDMAEQGGDFQEIPKEDLPRAQAVFSPAKAFVEGVTNGMHGVRIGLGVSQSGRACAGIKGEQFFKGSVDYSVTIGVIPSEGDTETAKTEEETAAHEFGHVIEDHKPGVRGLVHKFLAHRLGNEKPTLLAEVMPGVGFEDYEVGRKDHWEELFPDTIAAYYTGMTYADGYYTEIVSMGMEQLYRDAGHFAETDPEYFNFMCHILTM